ncbi:hypothetical protein [Peribacillus loiseleuriae]|uniref:Uncharacterized protein n=1 Tax=Peribacillus loiseleuriae TaxID=1679170 RepID=A0A0K9G3W7_9BACI|nr:hypothetical protein [Peribacillus loiseleuriae]KMY41500.1 hypothetical protein AC625_24785 [Peribacillus loiseleuriae]
MISILKHDVRKHIGAPLLLLAVIYILFCIVERQGSPESYELFVLRILSDHYLIIYGVTPVFLLSIFRKLEEDTPLLIVRFRTFARYFYTKWLAISIYAILFVLLQIITVLILGIGLPVGNEYPVNSLVENELFNYFEAAFSTPLLAVISSSLYMMIGLSFVGVSILTIFHFFNRRVVLITVLPAYLIMVIGLKIPALGTLPFITMNRYIILHHNLVIGNGILWSVTGMIVLVFVQIICIRFAWYRKFSLSWNVTGKGLFFYYARALWTGKIILLLCGIIGTLTIWKAMNGMEESMQDYILRFFYGLETGNFHLLTFLEQLIYYGTPLYLFALFIETWCSDDNLPVFIRIRQKKKWLIAIVSNGLIFHIIYIGLSFTLLFICGLLTKKTWIAHTIQISENIQMSIWPIFICLKVMELSVLFFTFFLLYIWLKNVTAAYLIVIAAHALILVLTVLFSYNPAGLVTIANLQIFEGSTGVPLNKAFTVLMLGSILLLGSISRSYKRFFN